MSHRFGDDVRMAVGQWLAIDTDPSTRAEIEALVAAGNESRLRALLLSGRMEFGTAGLRAAMGAGYVRMNTVTVAQAACGLALYLKEKFTAEDCSSRGVLVGYDARHKSQRFAQITASVMQHAGIRCRLTRSVCPTPWVAFGVRRFDCIAGVMVTASHNPKADNGYKVYWAKGSQIIPPHDAGIARCIEEASVTLDAAVCFGDLYQLAEEPLDDLDQQYFAALRAKAAPYRDVVAAAKIDFVYTAMHGVGGRPMLMAFDICGLPTERLHLVEQQFQPDPEFSTVVFPNPEEGKSSMDLSIKCAAEHNARVIIANDPDADRLAVAERGDDGVCRLFTGNELAALLGWWIVEEAKRNGVDLKRCIMLSSTVSSRILSSMAAKEGFAFEDTLTGFKWMGSRGTLAEETRGLKPIFAFEESIGFMCLDDVRDKDGISAASAVVAMASWLALKEGRTLAQQLQEVYRIYGYHACSSSYVISRDPAKTKAMFNDMRDANGKYVDMLGGLKVLHVRDLGVGIDTREPDGKPVLPVNPAAPVVTFFLEQGTVITVRGSGTEPKLKWYAEAVGADCDAARAAVDRVVSDCLEKLVRPQHYGFEARST